MHDAVLVDVVRTPVGKRGGGLSEVHSVDLSASVLSALMDRVDRPASIVDDVVWGCVSQAGEQSSNIGRWAVLSAGWPDAIPATTVDRACGSSQQAIHFAAAAVMSGQCDVVIAGGVESMSRVPIGSARAHGPGEPRGPQIAKRYPDIEFNQGIAAELIAQKWGFEREAMDAFSVSSHLKAHAAQGRGDFDLEIAAVQVGHTTVVRDEGVRPTTSIEALARLEPAFLPDGRVTAGSSSPISDGAAAALITSSATARRLGLTPRARFHSFALAGVDPGMMLTGPIPATARVLDRSGLTLDDIGVFEVNEAFASVTMAWLDETGADSARVNAWGGAIALGHPLGSSGARLLATLLSRMEAGSHQYGLQTMCEAGGMANALIMERL
ncbi:thiolase family protein [Dactylosporangium sp. NPDC051484]|uniref:thiolase family protein n=1 Tax=Dactylosporangium sp. NPDC051484 TaxID=3154942 RepID=UPI00344C3EE7